MDFTIVQVSFDATNGNVVLLSRSSNPSGSYLSLKDIDALIDIVSKLESLTLVAQLNPVVTEIKEFPVTKS